MSKRIQGWNPTYFGEPKKGSLASVIADITNKQNEQQGGKPEVMDSVAVQAQKAKEQLAKEGKNKKDAKGEDKPVKVHGEDINKKIEDAKMQKVKSLVDTIKDMFYTPEATQKELTDKQKKLPPALQKAIKAKEKGKEEAAKPDFLDIDKDGNKTEPMKKAAKDKKEK